MNSTVRIIIDFLLKIIGYKAKNKPKDQPATNQAKSTVSTPKPPKPPKPSPPPEPKPLVPVMKISPEIMKKNLMLGHYDKGISDKQIKEILKLYHSSIATVGDSTKLKKMRHGDLFDWVDLKPLDGQSVKTLQTFLVNAGIMHPNSNRDGIFAYATQAGVRMFQEYVRIYENAAGIIPTGNVDEKTWKIMKEWQDKKKTAENWARGKKNKNYKKYKNWMEMLKASQKHYQQPENAHIITEQVNKTLEKLNKGTGKQVDTFPLDKWTFDEDDIHLIGIRQKEDTSGVKRRNDDIFVLLINGMVFKFWGSTDPQQHEKSRKDEAFLSEGQHKFRFGWHNVSKLKKLYQALTPYGKGVLVFRDDFKNDNRLTVADIEKGIDDQPNTTINIHWTGIGDNNRTTWSAGCQVIAGKSYIDPLGEKRDCSSFTAVGSGDLQNNNEDHITRTKGAYNVFLDLLLLYPPKRVDYLIYTLGRDDTLVQDFLKDFSGKKLLADTLDTFELKGDKDLDLNIA